MTVYVDSARVNRNGWAYDRMWADTESEMRAMAETVGLAQSEERRPPHVERAHYLVEPQKKRLALKLGASLVDNFAFAEAVARERLPPDRIRDRLDQIAAVRRAGRVGYL